jgi:hypothetical protein
VIGHEHAGGHLFAVDPLDQVRGWVHRCLFPIVSLSVSSDGVAARADGKSISFGGT